MEITGGNIEYLEEEANTSDTHTYTATLREVDAIPTTFNITYHVNDPSYYFGLKFDITKTVELNAYWPIYIGRNAAEKVVTEDIINLEHKAVTDKIKSINLTFTSDVEDYLWVCVPVEKEVKIMAVLSSDISVPMEEPITVKVDEKCDYKCYRSTSLINPGTLSITIF